MQERTFHIITFGCQMNVHDSQWLGGALRARGFAEAPLEDAQVVVVNTCSVREKPEQKVMSALGRIRQVTGGDARAGGGGRLCGATAGHGVFEKIAGAPGGRQRRHRRSRRQWNACWKNRTCAFLLDFTDSYVEREASAPGPANPVAYVNIMQGCDNFCTYCIVPYTRGRQNPGQRRHPGRLPRRSWKTAREITLLGQNVNAWPG